MMRDGDDVDGLWHLLEASLQDCHLHEPCPMAGSFIPEVPQSCKRSEST